MGALITGWLSDYYIIRGKRSRNGIWVPEDRLRAVLPGIALFTALSVLGYGLTTEYVQGHWGILLNLFWVFLNGIGVCLIFFISESTKLNNLTQGEGTIGPSNVYAVDIFFTQNAEVSAVARYCLSLPNS